MVIGYFWAGGSDWRYLASALVILGPCVYGGLYALNDVHDAAFDCLHPLKRSRPIAAGRIKESVGSMIGIGLICFGLGAALALDIKILALSILFLVINLAYTFKFKSIPYFEILLNAVTHPLRFVAGLWLAGGNVNWLLAAIWLLAVFVIATLKRVKEMREASLDARPVLQHYNEGVLKGVIALSLMIMLVVWLFTEGLIFVFIGLWLILTLLIVVGYFYISIIRGLEEYLWR
jgi:4-hydroxybenzoate polyprenyltransferase